MKGTLLNLFKWSWVLTLPIVIAGISLSYFAIDRFYTFSVRYDPAPGKFKLGTIGQYELKSLVQRIRSGLNRYSGKKSALESIHLYVPESQLSELQSHMPQSGFEYVEGRILHNGNLLKMKFRYRGDFVHHWGHHKKSLRIKTSKNKLFDDLRRFNLQAPKFKEQLNNYLSYKLAKDMGLIAPRTDLVRVFVNGKDHGVHVLVEQLEELTLRQSGLMPADIYRGEIVGKDAFTGSDIHSLFLSTSVWDKVSVNNHYDEDSYAPLERLLILISKRDNTEIQDQLGEFLDLQAWGRFSAFETLAQSRHYVRNHNWRLYYDPWRQKLVPIVWDPAGWAEGFRPPKGTRTENEIILTALHDMLFANGEFIRARNEALDNFFKANKDKSFLEFVDDTVTQMEHEVQLDPLLRPPNPSAVKKEMRKLEQVIRDNFDAIEKSMETDIDPVDYDIAENTLMLAVHGRRPVQKVRLNFDQEFDALPKVKVQYQTPHGREIMELADGLSYRGNSIVIEAGFLANMIIVEHDPGPFPKRSMEIKPGYYTIVLPEKLVDRLVDIETNTGQGWIPARNAEFDPGRFGSLYAPAQKQPSRTPLVWSGIIDITEITTLERPLFIRPGTTIRISPGATLILKNRLHAEGSPEHPIRFIPQDVAQEPWGALVLLGPAANGSLLSHCEISGGSGMKGDLYEYSGMLSIHDVQNVALRNCLIQDNHVVDDMVHAVYSDLRFQNCTFRNSFADALDLDISTALITHSIFENSGNDGVDLMSTRATITDTLFRNNQDKGISVGEGSHLLAVNDKLVGNLIGIQVKDRSLALLFNQTMKENQQALHAYKKNWRYGTGGEIYLAKSRLVGNEKPIGADKHSAIRLFDSYVDNPIEKKLINASNVDDKQPSVAAKRKTYIPNSIPNKANLQQAAKEFDQAVFNQVSLARRGAQ